MSGPREIRAVEGACAPAAACSTADTLPEPWRLGRCGFFAPREVARNWKEALAGLRATAGTVF